MSKEIVQCQYCFNDFEYGEMYEYRGSISCEKCFDKMKSKRDFERQEIIEENKFKTDKFKGLDLSDSVIGKANKNILKKEIEIAKKESYKQKNYNKLI